MSLLNVLSTKEKSYQEKKILAMSLLLPLDIDECSLGTSPCDENADCANTDGSYSCTCKQGFTGDGTVCKGIHVRENVEQAPAAT